MREMAARWLARGLGLFLWLWVGVALVLNLSWANPDPPLVPRFEALAAELPRELANDAVLGFASGRPDRPAGYAWSAFRYALSPRSVQREARALHSTWIVADQLAPPPRYQVVRDFGDGLLLLRRR